MASKRLTNLYLRYNKKYFDNRLPQDVEVDWKDMSESSAIGCNATYEDSFVAHSIYIDSTIKEYTTIVKLTLLHEMCHVGLYPYSKHGKRFDEEMLRLAMRGAFKGLW